MNKIQHFTDLLAWQKGHSIVLSIYDLIKDFPSSEKFILSSQMQRSAISITSNIAEGFSRKGKNEKIQFYSISLGSITELQNQIIIAKDLTYMSNKDYVTLQNSLISTHKLVNGLIKSAQDRS